MGPAWHLFFSGDINRDLQGFPATAFPLAGGADLAFPFASPRTVCLYRFLPRFCLAVGPSDFYW